MRILREKEVIRVTGLSRSSIWRHERAGSFPARLQLTRRMVGWDCRDIEHWLSTRARGPKANQQQEA